MGNRFFLVLLIKNPLATFGTQWGDGFIVLMVLRYGKDGVETEKKKMTC